MKSFRFFFWNFLKKTAFYGFTLRPIRLKELQASPRDLWRGNVVFGQGILVGALEFNGQTVTIPQFLELIKTPQGSTDELLSYIHSFTYLQDIAAVNGNFARKMGRQFIEHWIQSHDKKFNKYWNSSVFHPGMVGLRVSIWLNLYDFYISSAHEDFKKLFLKSLTKQIRYLQRHLQDEKMMKNAFDWIWVAKALLLCEESQIIKVNLNFVLKKFCLLNQKQLLSDGGHESRSPLLHWRYLKDLIDLRSCLHGLLNQRKIENINEHEFFLNEKDLSQIHTTEEWLVYTYQIVQKTIQKMVPVLRLLRHVNGELVQFKGTITPSLMGVCMSVHAEAVDHVLSVTNVQMIRPPHRATSSGFERFANRSSVVLMNTYPSSTNEDFPPNDVKEIEKPFNILNFEWSVDARKLVHSGDLVINKEDGDWVHQLNPAHVRLKIKRHMKNEFSYLKSLCHAYHHHQSIEWQRDLYLAPKGSALKAVDTFTFSFNCVLALRFYLDPSFQIEQLEGHKVAIYPQQDLITKKIMPLKFGESSYQNNFLKRQHEYKESSLDQNFYFRSMGGDELFLSDQEDAKPGIFLMKECKKDEVCTIKWSFYNETPVVDE